MITRERFADYLLLKKLNEDPLGEVFRAGRLGGEGVEHVVLLRVFNGSVVSDLDLGPAIAQRKPLQGLLRSPNLGQGVDAGVFQGVPYVAYEYVSGKNLAALMEQAARKSNPVPTEHGLLIAERIALGLTVAYGARVGSVRATHGFLAPELVMLSNEGEIRLLGFEVSDGLRQAAAKGPLSDPFGRYLSPEALAGQPASSSDDVYSLAVILLELFVGRPLPHPSPDRHRAAIERVSSLGFPKVAALIERSLLPASSRIGDVVTWHKTLNQLILESGTASTPFHLAFYMHNLFRDDIERESAEIATEKTIDFSKEDLQQLLRPSTPKPASPAAPVPPLRPAQVAAPTPPPKESAPAAKAAPPPPTAATSREARSKVLALLGAFLVLALLGGGGFYAWSSAQQRAEVSEREREARAVRVVNERAAARPDLPRPAPAEAAATPKTTATVPATAAAPAPGPSPDDLLRQIDRAISERTAAVEENLRTEYDQEIQKLRDQLAASEAEREAERQAALEAQRKTAEAERLAAQQEEAPPETAAEPGSSQDSAETQPAIPNPGGSTATPQTAAAEPQEEAVRLGQLVTAGRGVIQPRVKDRPQPAFPMVAKRLRREADVEVEVLVDENGDVIDTRLGAKAGYGFDEAGERAARRTTFFPATKSGVRVKMWTTLKISFKGG
ncbi:MAG TPA: TonB family protein [Thermoanaerobaculia bacterium]|nr:TonB family protein [Thermoanaerobaculia bacterium]